MIAALQAVTGRDRPAGPPAASVRGRDGGIGRSGSPLAERVSDDLRRRASAHLTRRRRQAGLMLTATGAMGLVALYQYGLVRHLPDPPLPGFDSDSVDAAPEAYVMLSTPDTALAIASYGASLALVGMGDARRSRDRPWLVLAATAKLAIDGVSAAWLTAEQVSRHRALCALCLTAAAASWAAAAESLPEARAALASLR